MNQAAKDAAKFLKSTLRLPSSTFPARTPPSELAKYLPRCTDDLYAWQRRERPASNPFVLHDGPPYANGDLHVGHALNKIIKDIVCRSKIAEGKRVDYVPGWDCHGLPIELKALDHYGWKRGQGVDPVAIRKAAKTFARKAVEKQMAGFRSWAVLGDWNNHWKTMDKDFELRQLSVFQAMAQHGLIYRKRKPVYWSPSSGTALAEAELEYQDDHISTAAFVKFPVHLSQSGTSEPVYALIWTTTPWTLPANQAIAINSNLDYCRVRSHRHGLLIVARSRLSSLEQMLGESLTLVDHVIPADHLLTATYSGMPELGGGDHPIVHADFVSAESGTGLVHCAPGHGMEDYEALQPLLRRGTIAVKAPVDEDGRFDQTATPDNPGLLAGQPVFTQGNDTVLQMLQDRGWLVHRHQYRHKYPIDWRTKEPVIIRATAQWFADISSIKTDTMRALDSVAFLPATGATRLRSFVANRSEWCISRQRAWGVPIPAIYHKETDEAVVSAESIKHIITAIDERGIDAWWSDAPDEPAWIVPGLPPSEYRRGTDTMDVWFDSGTSWSSLLTPGEAQVHPLADIYLEGTDQHRGWFQSSLLTNVAYQKSMPSSAGTPVHAPFKSLVTHGFTLDAQGKKMSKSLGNVIAPAQIIAGFEPAGKVVPSKTSKKAKQTHPLGPDALRLWVASSDWTKDVVISDTVVKTVHTALDKYRVTVKLLLGLLQDFNPDGAVPYPDMSLLDQMALLQLYHIGSTVRQAYADLEFHKAVTAINRWVVADLSGFYFEAIKDVTYCDSPSSPRRRSAQTALHHILCQLQSMLGPVTPLLIEESWEHSAEGYRRQIQHPLTRIWEPLPDEWHNGRVERLLPTVMAINSAVKAAQEKARAEKLMGQSLACDAAIYLHPGVDVSGVPLETWKEILVVSGVEVLQGESFQDSGDGHEGHDGCGDGHEGHDGHGERHGKRHERAPSWRHWSDISSSDGNQIGVAVVLHPHGDKCARCWKYVVDSKDSDPLEGEHTPLSLCARCTDAVAEFQR